MEERIERVDVNPIAVDQVIGDASRWKDKVLEIFHEIGVLAAMKAFTGLGHGGTKDCAVRRGSRGYQLLVNGTADLFHECAGRGTSKHASMVIAIGGLVW